jgi:hypothetical protein
MNKDGRDHGLAKILNRDIPLIVKLLETTDIPAYRIAAELGVTRECLTQFVKRRGLPNLKARDKIIQRKKLGPKPEPWKLVGMKRTPWYQMRKDEGWK